MGQLGTMLIRAREARGLTLEDAERDTRISRRYLQALETERYEVIPAPVYARGFLRSYSQYLGIDPQSALDLFPRDESSPPPTPANHRPSNQKPVSAVGASRPAWKRPPTPARPGARPPPRQIPLEPTIGIDIGVPIPTRRIRTDAGSRVRSATVGLVALAVIIAVLFLAFLISRLASEEDGAGFAPTPIPTTQAGSSGQPTPATVVPGAPGVVPAVIGKTATAARQEITAAGFQVSEKRQKSPQPKDLVLDQAPVGGATLAGGSTVTISVSDGP